LQHDTMVLDPLHYLATLSRKPGALDHAPVYRDWELPACFAVFRAELQALHGSLAGDRRFVRVLQLLGEHPLARVRGAVEACRLDHLTSAEAVIQRTHSLAVIEASSRDRSGSIPGPSTAAGVAVPLPDLSRFDRLLGDSLNQDDSTNDSLNIQCCERSPANQITCDQFLGNSRSRDNSSNKALNIQCQDLSAAGRTTVFFA
ncbi:MAG TPA: hypothetical protein VJY15_26345, partial [Candidatus Acidoferrum sp.]|nr:hypothetical protein [Candidatus Acidoferrum sp.]